MCIPQEPTEYSAHKSSIVDNIKGHGAIPYI